MAKSVEFPGFFHQDGQYEREYPLRGVRHAVLGTLYSLAHRIGLDGTSYLFYVLCKNLSSGFFVVVIVCGLLGPASEVVVHKTR